MRMNVYGFPHKGLRVALPELAQKAGNTDYRDEDSLRTLKELADEVVMLLELHTHSEDEILLPALEAKVPGSTQENMDDHRRLENMMADFHNYIRVINTQSEPEEGVKFYNDVNEFYSLYIQHMTMEENEINPLIWANFTDEELLELQEQIMSTLNPDEMMSWLRYIIPGANPYERVNILDGVKVKAPVEFFASVMNMLRGRLTYTEYLRLETMLNEPQLVN